MGYDRVCVISCCGELGNVCILHMGLFFNSVIDLKASQCGFYGHLGGLPQNYLHGAMGLKQAFCGMFGSGMFSYNDSDDFEVPVFTAGKCH